jgi:hypothetical protein
VEVVRGRRRVGGEGEPGGLGYPLQVVLVVARAPFLDVAWMSSILR